MIDRKSSLFYDTTRKTFTAHHIRMYPMFNAKNNNTGIKGICTTLHHRDIRNTDTKKGTFVQNLELQRGLSLASPGGFLFRLSKDDREKTQAGGSSAKITLQGKRIVGHKDGELFSGRAGYDVPSIIKRTILQRRTLALTSASKLKELRIEGAKKFLLKAQENPQNERIDVLSINLKDRRDRENLLPPMAKHKGLNESQKLERITELKDSSISWDCNQILPRKPENLDEKKMQLKALRETHEVTDKEKCKSKSKGFTQVESAEMVSEITQKKRIINVFLPAISIEEQC